MCVVDENRELLLTDLLHPARNQPGSRHPLGNRRPSDPQRPGCGGGRGYIDSVGPADPRTLQLLFHVTPPNRHLFSRSPRWPSRQPNVSHLALTERRQRRIAWPLHFERLREPDAVVIVYVHHRRRGSRRRRKERGLRPVIALHVAVVVQVLRRQV